MKNSRIRLFIVLCLMLSCVQIINAQEREQKINVIIDSLQTVESMKLTYIEYGLKPLKLEATKDDSIKLIALENLLTDNEIRTRLIKGFNDAFTENEINDLYCFIKTTAFFKLLRTSITNQSISNQFKDIKTELDRITANIDNENRIDRETIYRFESIPVDREDGFYETIDYDPNGDKKDIQLGKKPAITKEDILEAKKVTNKEGIGHIEISLNKKGAKIFHALTKENIGKPIAIVIEKHIVSLPTVNSPISGGKMDITGSFPNEEIDRLIEILKNR